LLADDRGDGLLAPMRAMARPLALLLRLLVPLPAQAQSGRALPRVGFLSSTSAAASGYLAALQAGLREQGRLVGQTVLVEPRYGDGRFERLADLAAELVQLKVDVLVAGGAPAARAAQQAARAVPIVMAYVADPVGLGLVASLARPGGNVTGLSDFNAGVVDGHLAVDAPGAVGSPLEPQHQGALEPGRRRGQLEGEDPAVEAGGDASGRARVAPGPARP